MDESTDLPAVKPLCICVRFFCDKEKRTATRFWNLVQIFDKSLIIVVHGKMIMAYYSSAWKNGDRLVNKDLLSTIINQNYVVSHNVCEINPDPKDRFHQCLFFRLIIYISGSKYYRSCPDLKSQLMSIWSLIFARGVAIS